MTLAAGGSGSAVAGAAAWLPSWPGACQCQAGGEEETPGWSGEAA